MIIIFREVSSLEVEEVFPNRLVFKIKGQNFLYRMVRNIVGTLAYVGLGKIDPSYVSNIIKSCDRKQAGITAPAKGLFLHKISY